MPDINFHPPFSRSDHIAIELTLVETTNSSLSYAYYILAKSLNLRSRIIPDLLLVHIAECPHLLFPYNISQNQLKRNDDLKIWRSFVTTDDDDCLQQGENLITCWCQSRGLVLTADKSKHLHIEQRNNVSPYTIDNCPIEQAPQFTESLEAAHKEAAHKEAAHKEAAHKEAAHKEAAHKEAAHKEAAHKEAAHKEAAHKEAAHK
ncbi:hypothetical protein GJ496_005924 [Pomphorhynchus laevis]|nr:hypothetical protein GJ496_005924 [Pomphorhynchus laevis]